MEAVEKNTKPRIEVIDFENRRYPRFDIHLPIEYDQIKSSITHTGNLSKGGLLIYSPEETDVSRHIRLKLYFSSGSEINTIEVLAEVVWMDTPLSKDREYYQYGVKFVDISPKDETKLRNFLRSLSSPLDEMVGLFNALRMRLWTWKLMDLA
jgi:c-di-GMP-binding flagellar brake protein YcgR